LLGLGLAVFFRQTSGLSLSPVDEIESAWKDIFHFLNTVQALSRLSGRLVNVLQ
jgi:hypothetical protein